MNQINEVSYRTALIVLFHCAAVWCLAFFLFMDVNRWAGLLVFWALASSIICSLVYSRWTILYSVASFDALVELCAGAIIYAIIVLKVTNTDIVKDAMIAACLIHMLYAMAQPRPAYGLMGNPNDASAFIGICAPAFFRKNRWPFALYLPFGLVKTVSCCGMIAATLALIVALWFMGHHYWPVIVSAVGAVLFFFFVDTPGFERLDYWRTGYQAAKTNKWYLGLGPGNWKLFFADAYSKGLITEHYMVRLHNTFLEGFAEMGIGFVAVVTGYLTDIFRRLTKGSANEMAGLAACFAVNMTDTAFKLNAANGLFIIGWLAMTEVSLRRSKQNVMDSRASHI